VVVATYNRMPGLKRLLEALTRQDIGSERFEVIVVDDGSTDGTSQMLAGFEAPYRLRYLWQRNQGPGAARNAAIRAAKGEIIVTLDDDVEPAPDLLRRHLEVHAIGEAVAVIGRFSSPPDGIKLRVWTEWEFTGLERQYESMIQGEWPPTPRQFYTANSSVPKWAYLRAGLFDQLFRRAEDVELAFRLRDIGLGFRFLPEAVIYHRPQRSFEAWQRMAWQYGVYDIMMWRHKGRSHILSLISHEFRTQRPRPLQIAARFVVGHRRRLALVVGLAGNLARIAPLVGLRGASRPLLSLMFNLLYWQGAAEALGERQAFLRAVESEPAPKTPN
jgi:GT2 family glycosyltransferase